MKKLFNIFILLILILVLSSCFKMDYTIHINKDFSTKAMIQYDFSEINSMNRKQINKFLEKSKNSTWVTVEETSTWYIITKETKFWNSTQILWKVQNPCKKLINEFDTKTLSEMYMWYKSVSCKNLDKTNDKVLVTLKWGNLKNILEEKNWNYSIDLLKIDWKKSIKKMTNTDRKKSLEWFKMAWIKANYTIYFPSNIIKSDVWAISWNKLSYSVSDILKSNIDNPSVTFKKFIISNNASNISNTKIKLKSKGVLYRDLIISKDRLSKSIIWKKYIKQIDLLVWKLNYNKSTLEKLYNKLDKIDLTKWKYKRFKDIIIYLKSKIWLIYYQK